MKKILSSIVLVLTAMLLFCACGSEKTAATYPENYAPEQQNVKPISSKKVVTPVAKREGNRDYKSNSCVKYIDSYIGKINVSEYGSMTSYSGFIVTYSFTNTGDTASYMELAAGGLQGYQNGIKLSSQVLGEHNEYTEILPGATIQLQKLFETDNTDDSIEILSEGWGLTYLHVTLTPKVQVDEKKITTPYTIKIKGAGATENGNLVVDHTFTNTADLPVSPAHLYAVQAYQGKERLGIVNESKDSDGLYIKFFKADPGQTVDLSTTFEIVNREEDVTVYLTIPETAEIYDKQSYNVK